MSGASLKLTEGPWRTAGAFRDHLYTSKGGATPGGIAEFEARLLERPLPVSSRQSCWRGWWRSRAVWRTTTQPPWQRNSRLSSAAATSSAFASNTATSPSRSCRLADRRRRGFGASLDALLASLNGGLEPSAPFHPAGFLLPDQLAARSGAAPGGTVLAVDERRAAPSVKPTIS